MCPSVLVGEKNKTVVEVDNRGQRHSEGFVGDDAEILLNKLLVC